MFQVELSPSDIKYIFTIKLFDTDKKLFIDPALIIFFIREITNIIYNNDDHYNIHRVYQYSVYYI